MDQCTSTYYSTRLSDGFLFKSMFCSYNYIINNFYSIFKPWTKSREILLSVYALLFQHCTLIAIHRHSTIHRASSTYNSQCSSPHPYQWYELIPITNILAVVTLAYYFILIGVINVINKHYSSLDIVKGITCYPVW